MQKTSKSSKNSKDVALCHEVKGQIYFTTSHPLSFSCVIVLKCTARLAEVGRFLQWPPHPQPSFTAQNVCLFTGSSTRAQAVNASGKAVQNCSDRLGVKLVSRTIMTQMENPLCLQFRTSGAIKRKRKKHTHSAKFRNRDSLFFLVLVCFSLLIHFGIKIMIPKWSSKSFRCHLGTHVYKVKTKMIWRSVKTNCISKYIVRKIQQ